MNAICCPVLAGREEHSNPKRRGAGSTMGILDRQQACGHALDDLPHRKVNDKRLDRSALLCPMRSRLVLHLRVNDIPAPIAVHLRHNSLNEAVKLPLPLLVADLGLRAPRRCGDAAAG